MEYVNWILVKERPLGKTDILFLLFISRKCFLICSNIRTDCMKFILCPPKINHSSEEYINSWSRSGTFNYYWDFWVCKNFLKFIRGLSTGWNNPQVSVQAHIKFKLRVWNKTQKCRLQSWVKAMSISKTILLKEAKLFLGKQRELSWIQVSKKYKKYLRR